MGSKNAYQNQNALGLLNKQKDRSSGTIEYPNYMTNQNPFQTAIPH